MICNMCGKEESVYKTKYPIKFKGQEKYFYYCKGCANGGVEFGWLEAEDLEKIDTPNN